ncbi:MAG: lycopene cyclase family protein [Aquaticitalea sp.]
MPNENYFDYIIIGNGLAGLQLALGFQTNSFFESKRIALIDPSGKNSNDKTWSFWEQGEGQWDSIVHKSWNTALFNSKDVELSLTLNPYVYKSIRSIDFYEFAKNRLKVSENIHFIIDEIVALNELSEIKVVGKKNTYTCNHVFDSRLPIEYNSNTTKYNVIHQHFKGWVIETETACFQPTEFTMMDYRFNYKDSTSFIYVLPFSETRALIEFTFFTPYLVEEDVYNTALKNYITNHLKTETYKIEETEKGNIPMTDFPFWNFHTAQVTKIGTGGGWVKGSTGYSFKHTEKYVDIIIQNIKNGRLPSANLARKKFKFYDAIFLDVLKNNNKKGPWIFEQFYFENSVETMFRFLDEESAFKEDMSIMKSLFSTAFIKSFFRVLFRF